MTVDKISRGLTFKGIVSAIGSVMFVAGLTITIFQVTHRISFLVLMMGLLLCISGLILFFSIRGVLIDFDKKRIKPYFDVIIAKIGSWETLDQYDRIVLKYTNQSQRMNSRGSSTTYVTRSFDIVLTSNNKKDLIIKEFVNYDKAKSFLLEYSQRLSKERVDTYEIIKQRTQERKQQIRK
jgi:hypothetical protein